jgi:DNA helicase-2/ATP-dependent DNA helicase PcrA
LREFRGTTLYAIPSMFLDELPLDAIQTIDLSASAAGSRRAIEEWRGGGSSAAQGWIDAGVTPRSQLSPPHPTTAAGDYAVGTIVRHDNYGRGRVTDVSGHGAMRKVKVRFSSGERTFLVEKAKLEIVTKD